MKLQQIHFDSIKSSEKKFELRVNDEKRKEIDIGDEIMFTSPSGETVTVEVTQVSEYTGFPEPIRKLGAETLLPNTGITNNEEAIEYYHAICGGNGQTYEEAAKIHGTVLFELLLLNNSPA